jgi:antitoxin ParD1/3/4/toxin ParE1/3/4
VRRCVLAPEAAADLAEIWRYLRREAGEAVADRVEAVIRKRIAFLAEHPGVGHVRRDWTDAPVRFFPAYSWLIVYRPETKPLQVYPFCTGVVTQGMSCGSVYPDARHAGGLLSIE